MKARLTLTALPVLFVGLAGPLFPQDKAAGTLQVVKYDGLKQAVLKNRGKVVLVDFWDTL